MRAMMPMAERIPSPWNSRPLGLRQLRNPVLLNRPRLPLYFAPRNQNKNKLKKLIIQGLPLQPSQGPSVGLLRNGQSGNKPEGRGPP